MSKNNTTIQEFISANKYNEFSIDKLSLQSLLSESKLLINDESIFNKYFSLIKEKTIHLTLSSDEFLQYEYKPFLLSKDLYGTSLLWYLLLEINEMYSVCEFNKKNILVFDSSILNLIQNILIVENIFIEENHSEIAKLKYQLD